jgi:RNA polymerase sigma-70 factor (ECF subfamily)
MDSRANSDCWIPLLSIMRDVTISDIERLRADAAPADTVFEMDEEAFRALYDRTARALWAYLSRISGSRDLADDLLQETYYRFLRAHGAYESDAHRRNALFRIATNLARDGHRRGRGVALVALPDGHGQAPELSAGVDVAGDAERRTDLGRAMARLKPREREMLWLAYAQGSTHRDIAGTLGVKAASVRLLLFRARHKLAGLLREDRADHTREKAGRHDV